MDQINRITRLFPYSNDKTIHTKLKIDNESLYYISIREIADQITGLIIKYSNIPQNNIIISDITAGVGGNTLSFCMHVKHVNAIEIDNTRYEYLKGNINAYGLKNANVYNNDFEDVICSLEHNVIFCDFPWGGRNYKNQQQLVINVNNKRIENICLSFFDKDKMKQIPELIVLKLPKNYDFSLFNSLFKTKKFELNKMIILLLTL